MEKYIKEDLLEFVNQEYSDEFQKCWDSNDQEFWSKVVKTYWSDTVDQADWKEFFMTQINQQLKKVSVSVNRRAYAYIYISMETSQSQILRYACQQIPMTVEDFLKEGNAGFTLKNLDLVGWTTEEGSISMKYGDKASPKAVSGEVQGKAKKSPRPEENLVREEHDEKQWASLFAEKFGKIKKPRGQLWADLYEKCDVAKNPKEGWVLGAMVDAIGRGQKPNLTHYGYISRIRYNRENRADQLDIVPFHGKKETWIWNGSAHKGSWLPEDELSRAKQSKSTARDVNFQNLSINITRYELTL